MHSKSLLFILTGLGLACVAATSTVADTSAARGDGFRIATGSYSGNGQNSRAITGVGFQPSFLIISGNRNEASVARTSFMTGNVAKPLGKKQSLKSNRILSLDPDGFTIGTDSETNASGTTYYWTAFRAAPGEMAVGEYVGNDSGSRLITGVGFQPSYLIVMAAQNEHAVQRFDSQADGYSLQFDYASQATNRIREFRSDGFLVGSDNRVNENGEDFYYVAFAEKAGTIAVSYYDGNAQDNRNITGLGLQPQYAIVKCRDFWGSAASRSDAMTGDFTLMLDSGPGVSNSIQALQADGFQVGIHGSVGYLVPYYYIGFANSAAASADLAIAKDVDQPWPSEGDTVTYSVVASNLGPSDATGVIVADPLPAGVTYVSHGQSQGTYVSGTGLWTVGGLAPGSPATLTITASVDLGTAGDVIENIARIASGNETDPNSGNDQASIEIEVRDPADDQADLALTKVVDNPAPAEGATVKYTVTLTNNGPGDASGVRVHDLLPAGLTYAGHSQTRGTYDPGSGSWGLGDLDAGLIEVLVLNALVGPGTGGQILVNTASLESSDQVDPESTNNSASIPITVEVSETAADLAISKDVDRASPNERDPIVYTVTLRNQGPLAATGVVVTDALPPGLTYASHSTSHGTYTSATGIWAVGNAAVGATPTLTLRATVQDGTAGQSILNSASITGAEQPDPISANNSASAVLTVISADLAVTKSADRPQPGEGDTVVYTVTVRNRGPDAASGVVLTDVLPTELTYVSDSVTQGSYAPSSGQWTVGTLSLDAVATLTLRASVDSGTRGRTVVNTATITAADQGDAVAGNNTASVAIVIAAADLALSKSVDTANPEVGETVRYTITVSNEGPTDATAAGVTDLLPTGVTYASHTQSQGSYSTANGQWTIGALNDGASATLSLFATINVGTGGQTITNTASITSASHLDPVTGNNSDSAVLTVASADLSVSKTVDKPGPGEGESIAYSVTVTNLGPSDASNVVLTDVLPSGVTYVSHNTSQGNYSAVSGQWTFDGLSDGANGQLTIQATVDAGTTDQTIVNTATIAASDPHDPISGNNADSVDIRVGGTDLGLDLSVDEPEPAEGATVTFTLTLSNLGSSAATGVTVTDLLPVGLTYSAAFPSQGSYNSGSGLWSVGSLGSGGDATLLLSASVATGTAGSILHHTATITGTNPADPVSDNDSASVDVRVVGANLVLDVSTSAENPTEGDTLTLTLTLDNLGPDDASGVVVTDLLPAELSLISAAPTQGSYQGLTGLWTIGDLAVGGQSSLSLSVALNPGTGGSTVVNQAAVSQSQPPDPLPADNSDLVSFEVKLPPPSLRISVDPQEVVSMQPGGASRSILRVLLENNSPTDVRLTGLTLTNAAHGSGTPAELDREWSSITLISESATARNGADLPVEAQAFFTGGRATFQGLTLDIPAGDSVALTANGGASLAAADGDQLDVVLAGPTDLEFLDPVVFENGWPLDPAGNFPVDGMTWAQITIQSVPAGETFAGEVDRLALDVRLPSNGYLPDTLRSIRLLNLGDAKPVWDIASIGIWRDGGNEIFEQGGTDDVFLGPATWDGTYWVTPDFAEPVIANEGLHLFGSVVVSEGAHEGRTIRLSLPAAPALGVTMASGNDGPIDAPASNPEALTIFEVIDDVVAVSVVRQRERSLLPGGPREDVLELQLVNFTATPQTLETLTVSNKASGVGSQDELDGNWSLAELHAIVPGENPTLAVGPFADGLLTFSGLQVRLPVRQTVRILVRAGASLRARDSDLLDLRVDGPENFQFQDQVPVVAQWPLDPEGFFAVDGMAAAQIVLHPLEAESFQAGSRRNLVCDITLPANGYEADQLNRIDMRNLGSAVAGADISRVEIWVDSGDGRFSPETDLSLGSMVFTGERWETTALALAVPPDGLRVFTTIDLTEVAREGRTLRFALPGSPDVAIGMASGNDGPRDRRVEIPLSSVISSRDRLTLTAESIDGSTIHPGSRDVPLLHLVATNSYDSPRTLSEITFDNISLGSGDAADLDSQFEVLTLHADGLDDGIFQNSVVDPELGIASFSGGHASFAGLAWTMPARSTRHLFLAAEISSRNAKDGDLLGALLEDPLSVVFQEETAVVSEWPVDSGARWTIDGMVAAQIANFGSGVATVGPGQGPIKALDFLIPANGYAEDVLRRVRVVNLESTRPADLARMTLWRDAGDGEFSPDDDPELGALTWTGDGWLSPPLEESISLAGARFFVSTTIAATLPTQSTLRLAIPVGGLVMESSNDGPIDAAVSNADALLLSPSTLLTTLSTEPTAAIVGTPFEVRMTVSNHGDAAVEQIRPLSLMAQGTSNLVRVNGPEPATLALGPAEQGVFTWIYQGVTAGEARLNGNAAGVELPDGGELQSPVSTSNVHSVFLGASELELFPVLAQPFTVNRGQTGVIPVSLTFRNPGGERSSNVKLTRLRFRLETEDATDIVPSDLLARILVREGNRVYASKVAPSIETEGAFVDLALSPPVLITTFEPVTLNLQFDISPATNVPSFRAVIAEPGWLQAEDATSRAPLEIRLEEGQFPLRSGLAHLVAEATSLEIAPVGAAIGRVSPGQRDVKLLEFDLENVGLEGISSDVRVGFFAISITDGFGNPLEDGSRSLARIRVRTSLQVLADRTVDDGATDSLSLRFVNALTIPVNTPVRVTVVGDIADQADLGQLQFHLHDETSFDIRDANTRNPIAARYLAPIEGDLVLIERPAHAIEVSGSPAFPPVVTVGEREVIALTGWFEHPGTPGTARIRLQALSVECLNQERSRLTPSVYLSRLRLLIDGAEVSSVSNLSPADPVVELPVPDLLLEPGGLHPFQLVVSMEATAPSSFLELVLAGPNIRAFDSNSGLPVVVEPSEGSRLPLFSGLTRLRTPSRELLVGLESLLPPALAADEREFPVARISLSNPAAEGSGAILVDHLEVRSEDAEEAAMALGGVLAELSAYVEGSLRAQVGGLAKEVSTAVLPFSPPLVIEPGHVITVEIAASAPIETLTPRFRLGLGESDIGVIQPESALLFVQVRPGSGQSFPLWTEPGSFSPTSLPESYANFPNPFAAGREQTAFLYYLPSPATVTLRIWTPRGERVADLVERQRQPAGLAQSATWDGRNGRGNVVVNGVYLAELLVQFEDGGRERLLHKVAVVR